MIEAKELRALLSAVHSVEDEDHADLTMGMIENIALHMGE